jgi:hypothetical protein
MNRPSRPDTRVVPPDRDINKERLSQQVAEVTWVFQSLRDGLSTVPDPQANNTDPATSTDGGVMKSAPVLHEILCDRFANFLSVLQALNNSTRFAHLAKPADTYFQENGGMKWNEILDAIEEKLDQSVPQEQTTTEQQKTIKTHIEALREAMPPLIEAYEAIRLSALTEPLQPEAGSEGPAR